MLDRRTVNMKRAISEWLETAPRKRQNLAPDDKETLSQWLSDKTSKQQQPTFTAADDGEDFAPFWKPLYEKESPAPPPNPPTIVEQDTQEDETVGSEGQVDDISGSRRKVDKNSSSKAQFNPLRKDGKPGSSDQSGDKTASIAHGDGKPGPSDQTGGKTASIAHGDGKPGPSDQSGGKTASMPHKDGKPGPSDQSGDKTASIAHGDGKPGPSERKDENDGPDNCQASLRHVDSQDKTVYEITSHPETSTPLKPSFESVQNNPFYLSACQYGSELQALHNCAQSNCRQNLWFLLSYRNDRFSWTREQKNFVTKVNSLASSWNLSESFIASEFDSTKFPESRKNLVDAYQKKQMKLLRHRGISAVETLTASSPSEDNTKSLYWDNNSCALDSILAILPDILKAAEDFKLYATKHVSGVLTCPAASIVGALHFCQYARTSDEHKNISNLIRELCFDISAWHTQKELTVLWRPEAANQPLLSLEDVIHDVLCPLLGGTKGSDTNEHLISTFVYMLTVRDINGLDGSETLWKWLLECLELKTGRPKSGVYFITLPPRIQNRRVLNYLQKVLCTHSESGEANGMKGKIVGFLGNSAETKNHFVCGISLPNKKIRMKDGLREGVPYDYPARLALSTFKGSASLLVESICVVYVITSPV